MVSMRSLVTQATYCGFAHGPGYVLAARSSEAGYVRLPAVDRRQGLEDMTHTGGRRAPPPSVEQNCIDAIEPVEEFEADGARAFDRCRGSFAVLHEKRIGRGPLICSGDAHAHFRCLPRPVRPPRLADEFDPIFAALRTFARDHRDTDTARPAAIGERLPEIAGAGADRNLGTRASDETGHHDLGPTTLEASDRVRGLEFDDEFTAQQVSKSGGSAICAGSVGRKQPEVKSLVESLLRMRPMDRALVSGNAWL